MANRGLASDLENVHRLALTLRSFGASGEAQQIAGAMLAHRMGESSPLIALNNDASLPSNTRRVAGT